MLEWLFGSGLKEKEIDKAITKIREEYNHYIVHYQKGTREKDDFESRLRIARLKMMDMGFFLSEEIKIVKGLIAKDEERLRELEISGARTKPDPGKNKSYADRVIEQLQKAIEPYPSRGIHPEANLDVDKLYGTLEWLGRDIWPNLAGALRRMTYKSLHTLENDLAGLLPGPGRLSKEEEVYKALLASKAPLNRISFQQKELILQAAFWLHRVRRVMMENIGNAKGKDKEITEKALAFWDKVIVDFRLKDIQPPSEEKR